MDEPRYLFSLKDSEATGETIFMSPEQHRRTMAIFRDCKVAKPEVHRYTDSCGQVVESIDHSIGGGPGAVAYAKDRLRLLSNR